MQKIYAEDLYQKLILDTLFNINNPKLPEHAKND